MNLPIDRSSWKRRSPLGAVSLAERGARGIGETTDGPSNSRARVRSAWTPSDPTSRRYPPTAPLRSRPGDRRLGRGRRRGAVAPRARARRPAARPAGRRTRPGHGERRVEARRLIVELRGEERSGVRDHLDRLRGSHAHGTPYREPGPACRPRPGARTGAAGARRDGRGAVPAANFVAGTAHRHRDGFAGGLVRERPARHRGWHGQLDRRARPDPPARRPASRGGGPRGRVRAVSVGGRRSRPARQDLPRSGPAVRRSPVPSDRGPPAVGRRSASAGSAPSCERWSRRP